MAVLFQSMEEFRRYVSGAVDNDQDFLETIESDIKNAASFHLVPHLGLDLWERILWLYPDAPVDMPDFILTEKIQAALAPLALYHASKTKAIRFGNQGFTKSENSAFRYQENEYRMEMLNAGYEHLEIMLKYLEKSYIKSTESVYDDAHDDAHGNDDPFHDWEGREMHLSRILRYVSDFRMVSAQRISRHTFESLIPIVDEIEYFIADAMPSQFFERLKQFGLNKDEKRIFRVLKRVIASATVAEATRRQLTVLKDGQLIVAETRESQSSQTQTVANSAATERTRTWEQVNSNKWWHEFKETLTKNKLKYPLCFHVTAGGTNEDTDAWGYEPPAPPSNPYSAHLLRDKTVISL